MRWCRKDEQGDCVQTLRGVLARAASSLRSGARAQRRVQVELLSGLSFIDEVMGVEGEGAAAMAVFASQRQVAVAEIAVLTVELS